MAHGLPRMNICYDCNQYTLVSRFDKDPDCPTCGKKTDQTSQEKIREHYLIGFLYEFTIRFNHWVTITHPLRRHKDGKDN